MLTHTRTTVTLELSKAAHDEIALALRAAGYDHAFDGDRIDMHGISVEPKPELVSNVVAFGRGEVRNLDEMANQILANVKGVTMGASARWEKGRLVESFFENAELGAIFKAVVMELRKPDRHFDAMLIQTHGAADQYGHGSMMLFSTEPKGTDNAAG